MESYYGLGRLHTQSRSGSAQWIRDLQAVDMGHHFALNPKDERLDHTVHQGDQAFSCNLQSIRPSVVV